MCVAGVGQNSEAAIFKLDSPKKHKLVARDKEALCLNLSGEFQMIDLKVPALTASWV